MARACVCAKSTLLALRSWYLANPRVKARAQGCRVMLQGTQPRAPQPQQAKVGPAGGPRLCHISAARDAGSINSKEVRVNKRDSPRISKEIHIDRKQPLGVSLKGSSVEVLAACRLESKSRQQVSRSSRVT